MIGPIERPKHRYYPDWLEKNGFAREPNDSHRGDYFERWTKEKEGAEDDVYEVVFVTTATDVNIPWIERIWKVAYPDIYRWWKNDKEFRPYQWNWIVFVKRDVVNDPRTRR